MIEVDPPTFCVITCCEAAMDLLETLPETDLTIEIRKLMLLQYDMIHNILEDKQVDVKDLKAIIRYAEGCRHEAKRLRKNI